MRSFIKLFVALAISAVSLGAYAQVGINTVVPDTSAALHIVPKNGRQGLLVPRITEAQRTSIYNPAKGLFVYDLSADLFYYNLDSAIHNWFAINPLLTKGTSTAPNVAYTSTVVTNVGIGTTTPTSKLEVVGDVKSTTVTTNTLNVTGYPANSLVPQGGIIMWTGTTAPPGWAICDGNNGTPDLRGRFILGMGLNASPASGDINPNYTIGQTGGENLHTMAVAELPKHKHNANGDGATIAASGGYHSHSVTPNGQGTGAQRAGGNSGGLANDSQATIGTTNDGHSHSNAEFSGTVGDGTTQGLNNQAMENRPPYYVLAYIMKL